MRSLILALRVAVGGQPDDAAGDSADDTGYGPVAAHAQGGERPGYVETAHDPLSTFPLDGRQRYGGTLPVAPPGRFAVRTQLDELAPEHLRLDIGLRAGPAAVDASDIGMRLAFNPRAVQRYRLRDALGTGSGTDLQRVPRLVPGASAGATYDLHLLPSQRSTFLGTVTLTWTEQGEPHQQIMVLERPNP